MSKVNIDITTDKGTEENVVNMVPSGGKGRCQTDVIDFDNLECINHDEYVSNFILSDEHVKMLHEVFNNDMTLHLRVLDDYGRYVICSFTLPRIKTFAIETANCGSIEYNLCDACFYVDNAGKNKKANLELVITIDQDDYAKGLVTMTGANIYIENCDTDDIKVYATPF